MTWQTSAICVTLSGMTTNVVAPVPPDDVDATIRAVVRALIGWRGVTKDEVADGAGIPRSTLFRRLRGTSGFSAAEVRQLARYFGAPVTVFYEGPEALFLRITELRHVTSAA